MTVANKDRVVRAIRAGATFSQAAERFGVTRSAIAGIWNRSGFRLTPQERAARNARQGRRKEARNLEIIQLYRTGEWSAAKLGAHFGISASTVCQILELYGVPRNSPASKGFSR